MIRPLRDYLVLKPLSTPGMIGLLHIPDSGLQKDKTGGYCEVLAAGSTCLLAKKGDTVHVTAYGSHYAGIELIHEGKKVIMLRERDINGVMEGADNAATDKLIP